MGGVPACPYLLQFSPDIPWGLFSTNPGFAGDRLFEWVSLPYNQSLGRPPAMRWEDSRRHCVNCYTLKEKKKTKPCGRLITFSFHNVLSTVSIYNVVSESRYFHGKAGSDARSFGMLFPGRWWCYGCQREPGSGQASCQLPVILEVSLGTGQGGRTTRLQKGPCLPGHLPVGAALRFCFLPSKTGKSNTTSSEGCFDNPVSEWTQSPLAPFQLSSTFPTCAINNHRRRVACVAQLLSIRVRLGS